MSSLDRRGFLKAFGVGLAATAALATVDPEFLLWRPGAKSIFLPSPVVAVEPIRLVYMYNILTDQMIYRCVRDFPNGLYGVDFLELPSNSDMWREIQRSGFRVDA